LVGSTAILASRLGQGQPQEPLRVGNASVQKRMTGHRVAFLERMAELGYEEGRNFVFEFVQADGLAGYGDAYRELAARGVDIWLGGGPEVALEAILAVAGTLPVVMIAVDFHPIEKGYVRSLAEPGGNVTGLFFQQLALAQKRLQLLQEIVPNLSAATIFWDRISADQWQAAQASAAEIGLSVHGVELRDEPYDYERALAQVPQRFRGALSVLASPIFAVPERRRLPDFALRNRLPTMFISRTFVDLGGLMSYGPNFANMYRRAADYVDLIARGKSPAEIPIEQPTKFELVINLQTAKLLGMTIPVPLLLRADEVIE
jgi:putative ABC transport system substrate-binding protein